jgi:hypothetical protein
MENPSIIISVYCKTIIGSSSMYDFDTAASGELAAGSTISIGHWRQ